MAALEDTRHAEAAVRNEQMRVAGEARVQLLELDARLQRSLEEAKGSRAPQELWNNAQLNELWRAVDKRNQGAVSIGDIDRCIQQGFPELYDPPALRRAYRRTGLLRAGDGGPCVRKAEFPELLRNVFQLNAAKAAFGTEGLEEFGAVDLRGRQLALPEFMAGLERFGVMLPPIEVENEFLQLAARQAALQQADADAAGEEAEEAEEVRLRHLYRRQVVVRALVAVGWRRGAARCAVRPVAEEVEREETAGATVGIVVGAVAVGERRPPSGPGTHSLVLVVVVVVSSLLRCLREWGVYLWGRPRWTVHWREFGGRLRGRGCF